MRWNTVPWRIEVHVHTCLPFSHVSVLSHRSLIEQAR